MTYSLTAAVRTKMGKRAKDERLEKRIPAVLYGHGTSAQSLAVDRSAFLKLFQQAGFSSLIDLAVANDKPVKVLIKELQRDPLSMEPAHVDFYQVRMDEMLSAHVPLKFVGESRLVKEEGGTLVKSLDELEVKCLPADLPHVLEVNLTQLNSFDDIITVERLPLPQGVTVITDHHLTIVTVARPLTEEELKKLEESALGDVTAVKTEGEEKKAAEEAKKAEEAEVSETATPSEPEKK